MKSTLIVRGPVTVTYLRNGAVRIEAKKNRPRMHLRGDELLKLMQSAATPPEPTVLSALQARCGAL